MNYEGARGLPTLVRPLIINPNQRVGQSKKRFQKPLRQPPFPGIDLNWDGFAITHLHWGGFNNLAPRERWRIEIAMRHEVLGHCYLACTPYLRYIKYEVMGLYGLMLEILEKRGERIRVPLSVTQISNGGNELQEKIRYIGRLKKRSYLVEEVYAVQTSLYSALYDKPIFCSRKDKITEEDYKALTETYKNAYEKYYQRFSSIYEKYDRLVEKIGENAANAMVNLVFETSNPLKAFIDLLWGIEIKTNGDFSDLPYQIAYTCWHHFLNQEDPDDSRYGIKKINEVVERFEKELSVAAKDKRDDFLEFWLRPKTFMLTPYTNCILPFIDGTPAQEATTPGGRFIIALEAILQQLIKGIGLLCPFWMWSPGTCCEARNRELFEKVWECTSNSACERWQRMGCLVKGICKAQRVYKTSGAKE